MTTALTLSVLVIKRSLFFADFSIALCSIYVNLNFSYFCWLFHQCIDMIFCKIRKCTYCMVRFFWGSFFFIFDLKRFLLIRLIHCCDAGYIVEVSSKFD